MTLVAPRILNDVSYVTRINHEIHFAWQDFKFSYPVLGLRTED